MGKHLVLSALFFALAQTDASCAVTSTGGPGGGSTSVPGGGTATTGCPIPAPYVVKVAVATDISSVTVPSGSSAIDEANGGSWCDTTQVSVTKLSVTGSVTAHGCPNDNGVKALPCPDKDLLVAIELKPTPVSFPNPASRPGLKYDLKANPPMTGCETGCTLDVYQLRDPKVLGLDNWRLVAGATRGMDGSIPVARANVDHFSVFALVEHPAPNPVAAGGVNAQFVVSSDFLQVDEAVVVQLSVVGDGGVAGREFQDGMSLLFRFDRLDPGDGFEDPACPGDIPEILTCLFPIETPVVVDLPEEQRVSIQDPRSQTRVNFSASVAIT